MGANSYRKNRVLGSVPGAKEYLQQAIDSLSKAGQAIDKVYVEAELSQMSEEDMGLHALMEETVTTFRAMSRDTWEASRLAGVALGGLRKLADVEKRLDINISGLEERGKL